MSKTRSSSTEEKRPIPMTSDNEELKVEESVAVTETKKKKMLILRTNDNEDFEVEKSVAIQAVAIKNLIDVDDCASTVIPLPNVTSKTLAKVIEYLKSHADSKASKDDLKNFDKLFLQTSASNSPGEIIDLMLAANYLHISGLLDITSQKIADSIRDLSVEDARQYLDIENDFTPEEEEKIRKENAWAFI